MRAGRPRCGRADRDLPRPGRSSATLPARTRASVQTGTRPAGVGDGCNPEEQPLGLPATSLATSTRAEAFARPPQGSMRPCRPAG